MTHPPPAPDANTAPLEISRLCHSYHAGKESVLALDDVSLTFGHASMNAVVGPSGSGKSTLMLCAAGLEKSNSGSVRIDGQEITSAGRKQLNLIRRQKLGFIFQEYNLVPSLSAEMNVRLPSMFARARLSRAAARAALDSVGISDLARRRPAEMSGGQQQRVAIARALATRPSLLFADEPTGALDTQSGARVVELLRDLVTETGVCIVVVTHNPAVAAAADRVVFLRDGRVWDDCVNLNSRDVADRLADVRTA